MNLQQLEYLRVISNSGFNLSRAAHALRTSQPGITRYMQLLEEELGLQLFIRDKRRIHGLTPAGRAVVEAADQVLGDVERLRNVAQEHRLDVAGDLTIACAHAVARYTLPDAVRRFINKYPRVRLRIQQGHVSQIANWVINGEADLSIATAPAEAIRDLILLPCYEIHRIVVTPPGHPLLEKRRIKLEDLVPYPIITYDHSITARAQIVGAFTRRGLIPNVVLGALDADLMKTYVAAGLGIAIVAHTAFNKSTDAGLRWMSARHLFPSSIMNIGFRRNRPLTNHMFQFIRFFAPSITTARIDKATRS